MRSTYRTYEQYQRLLDAHKLLEKGWGLFLGKPDMENAEVLEPDLLRQQHYQAALALVARYQ